MKRWTEKLKVKVARPSHEPGRKRIGIAKKIGRDFAQYDYSNSYPLSVMPVTVVVFAGSPTWVGEESVVARVQFPQ